MPNALQPISEPEFLSFLDGRVAGIGHRNLKDYTLIERLIDFPIIFKELLAYNITNVTIAELMFKNCTFKQPVSIGDILRAGEVKFINCLFEEGVEIETYKNVRLLENCKFMQTLVLSLADSSSPIYNISVEGTLHLTSHATDLTTLRNINENGAGPNANLVLDVRCKTLRIQESAFKQISFVGGSVVSENSYFDRITANNVHIDGLLNEQSLQIVKSNIASLFVDPNSYIGDSFSFVDCRVSNAMILPFSAFNKIDIQKSRIALLHINGPIKKDSRMFLQELILEDALIFSDVFNEGLLSLKEVIIPSSGALEIRSSNLGKTDFILCDFQNASLSFENSRLTDIFVAETEFPDKVFSKGAPSPQQAQLAFGQISTAFQKQGDTVRTIEYQAREIREHYRQLKWSSDHKKWYKRKFSFTKLSLWLNKWSNDFGRSWQRGFLFSVICGFFFFAFLLLSAKEYDYDLHFPFDYRIWISFLRFMNPLRFFELETIFTIGSDDPFLKLSGWSYFWDFLGRVFVAYGVYQTIQAFRRYGKK